MPDTWQGTEASNVVFTDAGMLALWDVERFREVVDYDTWALELLEGEALGGHIDAGALVPINIGHEGAWKVLIRTGTVADPAALTERESTYLAQAAGPYLLITEGVARLSGLESVGVEMLDRTIELRLPAGRYTVGLHLLDWSKEPGARADNGEPGPHALPDFVVLIDPEHGRPDYRVCAESFDLP